MKILPSWSMKDWEVRAILAGATRSLVPVMPQPSQLPPFGIPAGLFYANDWTWQDPIRRGICTVSNKPSGPDGWVQDHSPFGQPGDVLYVRERFAPLSASQPVVRYAATSRAGNKWTPASRMTRSQSRIMLEVGAVILTQLGRLTNQDAKLCGFTGGHIPGYLYHSTPLEHMQTVWNIGRNWDRWNDKLWCWVIDHKASIIAERAA